MLAFTGFHGWFGGATVRSGRTGETCPQTFPHVVNGGVQMVHLVRRRCPTSSPAPSSCRTEPVFRRCDVGLTALWNLVAAAVRTPAGSLNLTSMKSTEQHFIHRVALVPASLV